MSVRGKDLPQIQSRYIKNLLSCRRPMSIVHPDKYYTYRPISNYGECLFWIDAPIEIHSDARVLKNYTIDTVAILEISKNKYELPLTKELLETTILRLQELGFTLVKSQYIWNDYNRNTSRYQFLRKLYDMEMKAILEKILGIVPEKKLRNLILEYRDAITNDCFTFEWAHDCKIFRIM